jgi:hypothetical protein
LGWDNGFIGGGRCELNLGPTVGQERIDPILTPMRNQEREREQGDKKAFDDAQSRNWRNEEWKLRAGCQIR